VVPGWNSPEIFYFFHDKKSRTIKGDVEMSSRDKSWTIERYPQYINAESGDVSIVVGYSYGCPGLGLMGYLSLRELFIDMMRKIVTEG
jgi:hypothetical protein